MTRRVVQRGLVAVVGVVCVLTGVRAGANELGVIFGCSGALVLFGLFMTRKSAT